MFKARMNRNIYHGCNLNDDDTPYSELETVLHRKASYAFAIYSFGPLKAIFISGLLDLTVIDVTQLECPEPADISLAAISCTFACHNKSKHVCVLQTNYSLAHWLNVHTLRLQYAKCPPQPAFN